MNVAMGTTESFLTWPNKQTGKVSDLPPVVLIAGATASGKSGLAVALARKWEAAGQHCTIINADSAQVYSDLTILSARPSEAEMSGIEHRLFGYVDGSQACSAASWAKDAKAEIHRAHEARRVPILVGGTGLYVRTLIDGIAAIPEIDPEIRRTVRAMPVAAAYAALQAADPDEAARLGPSDITRVARALEVMRSTGKPIAHWRKANTGGIGETISLRAAALLPPREWLYERCDARFSAMFEQGGVEEVEALLHRNLVPDLPVMKAIGVQQFADFIAGRSSKDEAVASGQMATRRYAKRQYTWFRNQSPASWQRITSIIDDNIIEDFVI